MKIEFIRKFKGREVGTIEKVADRVGHRFITKGLAVEKPIPVVKPKPKKYKKKYESTLNKSY